MATYKVLQDIEAEDKILGPLTLRQFIYGLVAALCLYLTYFVYSKGLGFMAAVFLPIAGVFGFFAFPWRSDQPTELWALAKIRFLFIPRRRTWDQSAIKELVTVTAPKKAVEIRGKGLSESEVSSRLHALANTLDSRGWVVKNANLNLNAPTGFGQYNQDSDRLLAPTTAPPTGLDMTDIRASDDILDEQNSPIAQQVSTMIEASSKAHRQKILDTLSSNAPTAQKSAPSDYWFLNQPAQPPSIPDNMVTFNTQVVAPGTDAGSLPAGPPGPAIDEENLVHQLDAHKATSMEHYSAHMHKIQPIAPPKPAAAPALGVPTVPAPISAPVPMPTVQQAQAQPQVTPAQQAAILNLSNNDDLSVAAIAHQAQRSGPKDEGEVVVNLH